MAYMKLSEAAMTRLHKALMEWLEDEPISYDLSTDIIDERKYKYLKEPFTNTSQLGTI